MIKRMLPTIVKIVCIYSVCLLFYVLFCFISGKPLEIHLLAESTLLIMTFLLYFVEIFWQKRRRKKHGMSAKDD